MSWGSSFSGVEIRLSDLPTPGSLKRAYYNILLEYFRLCALARSRSAERELSAQAYEYLFKVRVNIESSIQLTIDYSNADLARTLDSLLVNSFFGSSKKQGSSFRLPLITCMPTSICANGCYAHDALDAAPSAVVRGALNGWVAKQYEKGSTEDRNIILGSLETHIRKVVKSALLELTRLPKGFTRRANIRFAHVGELAVYPNFANALALQVELISNGEVDCVVYTRHPGSTNLDPDRWIINYTLHKSSAADEHKIPVHARFVYSAFDGELSSKAEANFLEHHRWSHSQPKGKGRVCPATAPTTKERTCDAVKCNLCFKPVKPKRS